MADAVFSQLDLEAIAAGRFRGFAADHGQSHVFGGQVVGQALVAAARTVPDRSCHSLHSYFLRPGDPQIPMVYEVEVLRDGRSFATRRVLATQNGRAIFSMSASFQSYQDGLSHQIEMPPVPGPEQLPSDNEVLEESRSRFPGIEESVLQMVHGERPVEVRQVENFTYFEPTVVPPIKHVWYRARRWLGSDLARHQGLLAYASDIGFLSTSNMPHGKSFMTGLTMASIDHSLWFHRPFDFNEWILIAMESTISAGGRAFIRASMFTRDGTLVASATQEGLLRESAPNNQ